MRGHAKLAVCFLLVLPLFRTTAQTNNPYRTVIDTELGSIFDAPNNFPWSDYGLFVGASPKTTKLNPDALRERYSHFNHFGPIDETLGFPYVALRQFEAQEVAAGRPPIFVTATYAGKKRPVLLNTYLDLGPQHTPRTAPAQWTYAVNVQDERFINFWINRFVRPVVLAPMANMRNVWVYVDGCQFTYAAYGVLDDNGQWVAGVAWDPPFPQNASDYLSSIAAFFSTLKQLAPDIKVMTDVGSMSDPTQFQTLYANIPGALAEDAFAWYTSPGQRGYIFYNQLFPWFSWIGATGRIGILGANIPENSPLTYLLSSFVTYELVKGQNFFFAPRYQDANATVSTPAPPAVWGAWNAALGSPVGTFQQGPPQSQTQPWTRLYSRQYTNGYVYLNWTGVTQTVTLPAGNWVDPSHHFVNQLTIPTSTGTFVSVAGSTGTTTPPPGISPRSDQVMTGPVTVTLKSPVPNVTIRYTLDGSTPTPSSAVYSGPFQLNSSTVVNARAYHSGYNPSNPSSASFTVTTGLPTVQFTTSSDSGSATGPASTTTYYPVLVLSNLPKQTVVVTYSATSPNGQTTTGSATFLRGAIYTQFPVNVPGSGTWRIVIENARGAVLGSTAVIQYSKN